MDDTQSILLNSFCQIQTLHLKVTHFVKLNLMKSTNLIAYHPFFIQLVKFQYYLQMFDWLQYFNII